MVEEVAVAAIPPFAHGRYRLQGTATVEGTGARRRIDVYGVDGRFLRSVYSNADGSWQVDFLRYRRYLVVARDEPRDPQFNAAAADYVTPVPMES